MLQEKNNPLKQEKIRKREELLKQGINPYPNSWSENKQREPISKLIQKYKELSIGEYTDEVVCIAGRLMRKRPMGKAAFFNLQDEEYEMQCYIKKDDFSQKESPVKSETEPLENQPSTEQAGEAQQDKSSPPAHSQNVKLNPWEIWKLCDIGDIIGLSGVPFKTKKGELSLRVKEFTILCKALSPLPEKYHGLEDKELKYRYRYLDLIMDLKSRQIFKTRSKIIKEIRHFMNKKGFMEVETPILQPIYGGALAEPFETYFRRLNQKMYLKISPEMYLKKLIVGGFEKVFEIGKNFRNEGIDRTHNPEFTMMEYYEAYTDYKDQMKQFEDLIQFVVKKIKGSLKFEYQGKELDFEKKWEKITLKQAVQKHSPHSIDVDSMDLKNLVEYVKSLDDKADLKKFEGVLEVQNPPQEDVLTDLKGELLVMAFEQTAEKNLWNPTFVIDFPLAVSPLTKKHRLKECHRLVERFEPYIAGMEIGNAYTELNDPIEQRQRLEQQNRWLKDDDPIQPMDENFLHALEVGMPPTGGVGLGIERLVMILTNQNRIKDSLLFPVLKDK